MFLYIIDDTQSDKDIIADLEYEIGATAEIYYDTNAPSFEMPVDLEAADLAFFSESVLSSNAARLFYHELDFIPAVATLTRIVPKHRKKF